MEELEIFKIMNANKDKLLMIDGVEGVGVGRLNEDKEELGIVIYTSKKDIESIPKELTGQGIEGTANTIQIVTGEFRSVASENLVDYKNKIRPVQSGYSIGTDLSGGAGTTSAIFGIEKNGKLWPLVFGNAHVLIPNNSAPPWPYAIQPGGVDGGNSNNDKIAEIISRWPLHNNKPNLVDCAFGRNTPSSDILSCEYPNKGIVKSIWKWFNFGKNLYKVGRTTGAVTGQINSWYGSINVNFGNYGGLGKIRFDYVTVVKGSSPVSLPGDSGSMWLSQADDGWAYAGVNFAGSDNGKFSINFSFSLISDYLKKNGMPLRWFTSTKKGDISLVGEDLNEEIKDDLKKLLEDPIETSELNQLT